MNFFKKRSYLLPLLVFVLVTLLFFWKFFFKGLLPIPADIVSGTYFPWLDLHLPSFPAGVPVKNSTFSDIVSIMYPWRELSIDLVKSGQLPLWNPYILSGTTLLANFQSGALYPLNVIYFLVKDFATGWSIQVILQPFLAAVFMYIFLRERRLTPISSVFGSLVWGFSGFFMGWLEYNTLVQASLYLPLALYALSKGGKDRRYFLLYTLSIALSFYAGYPQITVYIIGTSFLFLLLGRTKKLILFIISTFLAVGLASPLLVPGLEAERLSIRGTDPVVYASNIKFIPPQNIITFIAPDYFGNPTTRNYWPKLGSYDNFIVFAGIIPSFLFLSSFWIKTKKDKLLKFSWLVFFVGLILAFENPVSKGVGELPLPTVAGSVMGRLAVLTSFGIALSSSIVLEELKQKKTSLLLFRGPAIILLFLLGVYWGITLIFVTPLKSFLSSDFALFNPLSKYTIQTFAGYSISIRNLLLPTALTVFSILLFWIFTKTERKSFKKIILVLIFALTLFDLFRFHSKYNSFSSRELLYPPTPLTDFLIEAEAPFVREKGEILPPNMWMPYKLFSPQGQDSIHSLRYNKFVNLLHGPHLTPFGRYVEFEKYDSPLLNFLGVKYLAAVKRKNDVPDYEGGPGWRFREVGFPVVFENERTILMENKNALPRIFAVKDYKIIESEEEFERLLTTTDLSKTVLLEEKPLARPNTDNVNVSNISFKPLVTSADIESGGDSLLVISQTHFPGWKAYLNGKETQLLRGNYAFIAVPVNKGSYKLEVKYEPVSFKVGLTLAGISFIIGVLLYKRLGR